MQLLTLLTALSTPYCSHHKSVCFLVSTGWSEKADTRFIFSITSANEHSVCVSLLLKGKVLPYWLPSVEPEADPGVQAVSQQVKVIPGGRLTLLAARPAFYFRKRSPDGATPN